MDVRPSRWRPLRCAPAILVASAVAAARDVSHVHVTTSLSVFAALTLFLTLLALFRAATERVPPSILTQRAWRILAVCAAVLPPFVFGLFRWFIARRDVPIWTPILFAALATGAAFGLSARSSWRESDPARSRARTTYAILFGAAFIALHVATGTLQAIRPNTEYLHLALFCGTMVASWTLPVLLDDGLTREGLGRYDRFRAAACALVGLAFMELDRRMLVDLYPAVHVWLGLVGLVAIDSACRFALDAVLWRIGSVAGVVASAVVLAVGGWFTATRGGGLANMVGRAEAQTTPLGATVLQLMPERSAVLRPHPTEDPALRYPQYLNEGAPDGRYNVLLVTVDALRFDQLGTGGRKVTYAPSLQAFADGAVRFRNAYAQGPRTSLAMSSLLLGRYSANIDWDLWTYRGGRIEPRGHEARDSPRGGFVFTTVPKFQTPTIVERLKRAGYFTVAVPFAGENEFFRKGVGFERGFDVFADLSRKKWRAPTSARVLDVALRQLNRVKTEPWFLWVHFYDPHESRGDRNRYQELVHSFDEAFGKLMARLQPVSNRTVVVVLADHGEALGEHRHTGHASSLYDEQTKIPMLVRMPGVEPRDEGRTVAAIDVTATLATLARADTSSLDGVNLLPLMRQAGYPPHRPIFTELHRYISSRANRTSDLTAVVLDGYKLIVDWKGNTAQLFRLDRDPGETNNLVAEESPRFERLYRLVENYRENAEYHHPLP